MAENPNDLKSLSKDELHEVAQLFVAQDPKDMDDKDMIAQIEGTPGWEETLAGYHANKEALKDAPRSESNAGVNEPPVEIDAEADQKTAAAHEDKPNTTEDKSEDKPKGSDKNRK